jgi:putative NADH-flavin reductase
MMLVIGATGPTGREVVREALARGCAVAVLVRDPSAAASFPAGVHVHVGDVREEGVVRAALAGEQVVVSTLGVRRGTPVGTVRSDGTRVLVQAMAAAGVARLVSVSSIGVGSSLASMSRGARFLWPRVVGRDRLAEADRAEAAVRASSLDWTIVRPPRLIDGPASGKVQVGPDVALGMQAQITRADLARVLVDQALDHGRHRVELTATAAA